jgi:hypothetical protein
MPCPGQFTLVKDSIPIVQEAGPVWMGAENLAPMNIRSPDHPARSKVCPGPQKRLVLPK